MELAIRASQRQQDAWDEVAARINEAWEQRASRFRLWDLPDDPFGPHVWTNPYLPPLDPPRVSVWGEWWEPVGHVDDEGYWHAHVPPPVRAELTSEQWALWWDQQWSKPEHEFPRPWSTRRWLWLGRYTPFVFRHVLDREEENNLVAQARGRIRFGEGTTDGLRIVHTEENRSPGPFRRRHGAQLPHRRRSKSGRR